MTPHDDHLPMRRQKPKKQSLYLKIAVAMRLISPATIAPPTTLANKIKMV
jgi:hypothetical protein